MRKRTSPATKRVGLLLALAGFALVFFGGLPDHLILFPSRNPIDPRGAVRRMVPFENGELELWTAKSRVARKDGQAEVYVLRFYGNADRAEWWVAAEADMWNERAIEIWGMNYPGFGGSSGPAKLARVGPAAVAAFDALERYARENAVESAVPSGSSSSSSALRTAHATAPIVLFGASLGTTAALHVAANRSVAGVILHNPPAIRQMILRQFGWWNLWLLAGPLALQIPKELDSIANAKAGRAPAIFLLSEKDEVVLPRYHRLVVNAYAGEKRVIALRGAHHNDPIEGAALADLYNALDWLLPGKNPR
ncbi:MAG: alpha/beta hydrolase [Chthoniobacterales bacterium]